MKKISHLGLCVKCGKSENLTAADVDRLSRTLSVTHFNLYTLMKHSTLHGQLLSIYIYIATYGGRDYVGYFGGVIENWYLAGPARF